VSSRAVFMAIAAGVLAVLLFVAVVRPAIERGGPGELVGVAAAILLVILGERWLRSR
jgi:hypothetical protein